MKVKTFFCIIFCLSIKSGAKVSSQDSHTSTVNVERLKELKQQNMILNKQVELGDREISALLSKIAEVKSKKKKPVYKRIFKKKSNTKRKLSNSTTLITEPIPIKSIDSCETIPKTINVTIIPIEKPKKRNFFQRLFNKKHKTKKLKL